MAAIKAAVGIAIDIAGSVIRVGMVPQLALGIFAAVTLGPSGTAHADTSTDTFVLGVISAVMLIGMLIAGCVAIVSPRHSASYQQGNDYAMQQAYPGMSGSIQVECDYAPDGDHHDVNCLRTVPYNYYPNGVQGRAL
jgi:hypothetical protein